MDWRVFVSVDEEFSGVGASGLEQAARAALSVTPEFAGPEAAAGLVQLSLLLTDDATVRALNAQYRGLDETTDVLSFSSEHPGHWEGDDEPPGSLPDSAPGGVSDGVIDGFSVPDSAIGGVLEGVVGGFSVPHSASGGVPEGVVGEFVDGFILPPGEPRPLGEVVISYPQAARQAAAAGRSVDGELRLLVVHGTLHLIGYDHAEPGETRLMQSLERAALQRLPSAADEGAGDGLLSGVDSKVAGDSAATEDSGITADSAITADGITADSAATADGITADSAATADGITADSTMAAEAE